MYSLLKMLLNWDVKLLVESHFGEISGSGSGIRRKVWRATPLLPLLNTRISGQLAGGTRQNV
jgi:hypothetical protein